MKNWLAQKLGRALIETDSTGAPCRPGGNAEACWEQPDTGTVAIISRGDALDLYIGRREVFNVTLSARTAKELGFWLARWWVFSTWCGLKHKLWYWSTGVIVGSTNESRKSPASLGRAGS